MTCLIGSEIQVVGLSQIPFSCYSADDILCRARKFIKFDECPPDLRRRWWENKPKRTTFKLHNVNLLLQNAEGV